MLKAFAMAIYVCWTPADSAQLALEHPEYIHLDTYKEENRIIEKWLILNREKYVVYEHPYIGEKSYWCYQYETYQKPEIGEVKKPGSSFDPGEILPLSPGLAFQPKF